MLNNTPSHCYFEIFFSLGFLAFQLASLYLICSVCACIHKYSSSWRKFYYCSFLLTPQFLPRFGCTNLNSDYLSFQMWSGVINAITLAQEPWWKILISILSAYTIYILGWVRIYIHNSVLPLKNWNRYGHYLKEGR